MNRARTTAGHAAKGSDLSASLEDYLEAIYNLTGESQVARSKDIAGVLGVSRASVTGALRALKQKGLAHYKPYDYVTLTEGGRQAAAAVAQRHSVLASFFTEVLGVDADTAQRAACRAEHSLGPKLVGRLLSFIGFVTKENENGYDLATKFKRYHESRMRRSKTRK